MGTNFSVAVSVQGTIFTRTKIPVTDHIKTMLEMFNELSIVGDAITDEDRVVYLLASLPESFNTLVIALESNPTVPEMETVIERLMHEERKL